VTAGSWRPNICRQALVKLSCVLPRTTRIRCDWPWAQRLGKRKKLLILKTLESTNNNKTRAAEMLAISLKTLHNKLKEYGSTAAEGGLKEE